MVGAPLHSSFVGREAELALLTSALDGAADGGGALVLVSGEPGIGKTTLGDEAARRARSRGFDVALGRAWEGGKAPAFWPWMPILEAAAEAAGGLAGESPELAHLMPHLRPPGSAVDSSPADDERGRFDLFRQATELLRAACRERPHLVVIDDVHGADEASLLLLRFAAQALTREPILFVAMFRKAALATSEIAGTIGELLRDGELLALEGLDDGDVRELLEAQLATAVPDALVERLHEATGGNPFFVEQIARAIASSDLEPDESLPIPDAVRIAVRRNLAGLPSSCHEALRSAAVLGQRFDLPSLGQVLEVDGGELVDVLTPALDDGVVVPDEPAGLRFRHALLRETIYDDLQPAERLRLHLSVGEALEKLHGVDPDPHLSHIAFHFLRALPVGDPRRAIRYARGAGVWAASVSAWEEARAYYESALQIAETSGDEQLILRLLCDVAVARMRIGDLSACNESALRALRLAAKLGEPERASDAATTYSHLLPYGVADTEAIRAFREAVAVIGTEHGVKRARVLARLAVQLAWAGDRDGALAAAGEASELVAELPGGLDKQRTLVYIHRALWGPDSLQQRLDEGPEIARIATQEGRDAEASEAYFGLMISLLEACDVAGADRALAEASRLAVSSREPRFMWHRAIMHATRDTLAGRFEEAERSAEEALRIGTDAQEPDALTVYGLQLALLRREQERLDELVPLLGATSSPNPVWRSFTAYVHVQTGNEAEARATLDILVADGFSSVRRDENWLAAIAVIAEVAVALGHAGACRDLYSLLVPYAGRAIVVSLGLGCLGPLSRVLGLLARHVRGADASAHFERSVAEATALGSPHWLAHAQLDLAEHLDNSGEADRVRVSDLAAAAAAGYEAFGLARGRERAARLAAGGPAPVRHEPGETAEETRARLVRSGSYWEVTFQDAAFRVRHMSGLSYLAQLLASPGREFHVADLVARPSGSTATGARPEPGLSAGLSDAGDILDERSKAEYKRRLDELREDLQEAEAFQDADRAGTVQEEIDTIARTLAQATGLGGRSRKAGSESERARLNVTRALRTAIRRIEELCPPLGLDLTTSVRTGIYCAYEPDPRFPVSWTLER